MMKPGYVYKKKGVRSPWIVKCLEIGASGSAFVSYHNKPYDNGWIGPIKQKTYKSMGKAVVSKDEHIDTDY